MTNPDFEETIKAKHLPMLDGLRAVAAFSVVLAHGYDVTLFDGVTAFFVLSGFLITTLLLRERAATGSISIKDFYLRRTLRIFPAYYACVVASYVIDRVAGNPWPEGLAPSAAAYLVNYFNAFNGHPNTSIAHMWSLGVEEQFYLLWPALFVVLVGLGQRALRAGLVGLILCGVAWRCVLYFGGFAGHAYLYNAFDARFDNLAIGCLLATVATETRTAAFARDVGRTPWMPLVTLAAMIAVLRGTSTVTHHLIGFTAYAALVAVLMVQLLQLHRSAMWRWLDFRPVRFLGTISYPIYLYHGWGMGLGEWLTGVPHLGRFVAGVAFTIAGAIGSYYIVERPFLRLKHRFTPARSDDGLDMSRHYAPARNSAAG